MSGDATAARRPGRARVGALGVPRTRLLDDRDAQQQMEHFGVLHDQIRHDFAISHVLAAIAPHREHFIFYGGTALSRSILDGLRLSEDIDLLYDTGADIRQDRGQPTAQRHSGMAELQLTTYTPAGFVVAKTLA